MQISKINHAVPRKLTKQGSGSNNRNINSSNTLNTPSIVQNKEQQPSFKGLDSFCLGVANLIENGGLFISFTLQDMLGTNIPRPFMGLFRNSKENKGEKNKSFAAKELVREMTTGPSMFIIPGAMLKVGKPLLGKTIDVPTRQIKALGDIYAANPDIKTKQEFFEKAFTTMFENANFKGDSAIEKAKDFATKLSDNENLKKTLDELSEEFVGIVKKNADDVVNTDFTVASLSGNAKASFEEITTSIMAYADDVLEQTKSKGAEIIKEVTNKRVLTRVGTNAVMYASVIAFLTVIPKLYNKAEGKGNSGLKGLTPEETTTDKPNTSSNNVQKTNGASPSFGSSSTMTNLVNTITTDKGIGKFFRGFEFSGMNVSFPMLLGLMAMGVLIPRTIQAKDKYDREEILRRDLVTCATMCFGEKILQKAFSKMNETKSGFVLATKQMKLDKNASLKDKLRLVWDYLRPIKGTTVMSTRQIESIYAGINEYKNGILGFCDKIDWQGGKLNKIFSLTEESRNILKKICGQNIDNLDNATIRKALETAQEEGSEEIGKLTELFHKTYKTTNSKGKEILVNNPWVKQARTLNARFTALSVLVLVPVFLGFLLPAINERATKKRISQEALTNGTINAKNPFEKGQLMLTPKPEIFKEFQI